MVRIARPIDYYRIQDLKTKLEDPDYLSHAIQRIAGELAHEILQIQGDAIDVVEQSEQSEQKNKKGW